MRTSQRRRARQWKRASGQEDRRARSRSERRAVRSQLKHKNIQQQQKRPPIHPAVTSLIHDLARLGAFCFPVEPVAGDANAIIAARKRKFSYQQRRALTAYVGERCEVPSCGATFAEAPLTVHHILFRRNGGQATLENAELVCVDCHQGGHGQQEHLRTIRKCPPIAVTGLPIRTMFQVLDRFVATGCITATAEYSSSEDARLLSDTFRNPKWHNRRSVVAIHVNGPGTRHFRACQRLLEYVVQAAHIAGRLTPDAEQRILHFVDSFYIERLAA